MHLSMHNWMRVEPLDRTCERLAECGYESIEIMGESELYADRAATRAALALALTVIPNANAKDELTAGATSATKWLARQQSARGAWPLAEYAEYAALFAEPVRVEIIQGGIGHDL